jgi:hypothetical protein
MSKGNGNGNGPSEPAYGSGTVTVCCKLPNGIYLQLHEMTERTIPDAMIGTRQIKMARAVGDRVLIKGYKGLYHNDEPKDIPIIRGYATTPGIDRFFWESWLEQNKDNP